jgi:FolB domain-containing protein
LPDLIELRGLRLAGVCGVLPEERERRQPLEVDIDVVADLAEAGRTDDLAVTVDYGRLCDDVERVVATNQPQLLERLAELIAQAVLGHECVVEVTVALRKLRPPVPQQLATSGVRITRGRG